jgi:general L-amino acid transport system substrate-binding protein
MAMPTATNHVHSRRVLSRLMRWFSVAVMAVATPLAVQAQTAQPSVASARPMGATLKRVVERGELVCGVNPGLAGFAQQDAQKRWRGLDVDFCRAMAAAIFGAPDKVRFVPLTASERFAALQAGRIDVLSRNTTWTLSADSEQKLAFGPITFFDGQGFLVRRRLNVTTAAQFDGISVCVQQGTTSDPNMVDYFRANAIRHRILRLPSNAEAVKAYAEGRCDALTTDASGLYAERLRLRNPDDHIVLPDIISKEPLGPAVRHGDDQWFDIMQWTHHAMVNAEELGVAQASLTEAMASTNPAVRRLVGLEGGFGEALGLGNDWAVRILRAVGNYGESFERNLGGGRLNMARGQNALWTQGGLQYAPPIR